MRIADLVEILKVWPSPLGGAFFKCVKRSDRQVFSCRAGYKVISRIPKASEFWMISGDLIYSQENGVVCHVITATIADMPSAKHIGKVLRTHESFRGFDFGQKKVGQLLAATSESDLLDMLNNGDWQSISHAGLSVKISKRICDEWLKLKDERELAAFFHGYQLEPMLAARVTKMCSRTPIERLKENPYALLALSSSTIKVLRAIAAIARKLGIDGNDDRALVGLVEYALYEALVKGHTIVPIDELRVKISRLSKVVGATMQPDVAICAALKIKAVCVFFENSRNYIQLIGVAYIELCVERKLAWLHRIPIQLKINGSSAESVGSYWFG